MSHRFLTLPVLATFALACSADSSGGGGTGPGSGDSTVAEESLHFLRPALTAPAFAGRTQSFWAVRGERREIRLMYQPEAGQVDSFEFVRFRIDDNTLVKDSAGNPLAVGDSVLITLTLSDTLRMIVEFQPSGLQFDPANPARLWIKFGEADPDLNEDGAVTPADSTVLLTMKIWRLEQTGQPWTRMPSFVNTMEQEVEADLFGFTRYAVAY